MQYDSLKVEYDLMFVKDEHKACKKCFCTCRVSQNHMNVPYSSYLAKEIP